MSIKGKLIEWILRGVPTDPFRRKLFIIKGRSEIDKYLKEDKEMEGKKWFESKAVWIAIIATLLGAVEPISTAAGHKIIIPLWMYKVLSGLGLYALRVGNKEIE